MTHQGNATHQRRRVILRAASFLEAPESRCLFAQHGLQCRGSIRRMGFGRRQSLRTLGAEQHRGTPRDAVRDVGIDRPKTGFAITFRPFGIRFEFICGDLVGTDGIVGPVGPGPPWKHLWIFPPSSGSGPGGFISGDLGDQFNQCRKDPLTLEIHGYRIGGASDLLPHTDDPAISFQ